MDLDQAMQLSPEERAKAWGAAGLPWSKIRSHLPGRRRPELQLLYNQAKGKREAPPVVRGTPAPKQPRRRRTGRQVRRYLLTCAQNNTRLHEPVWRSLTALAGHYDAELLVGRVMYDTTVNEWMHKPGRSKANRAVWFDKRIEPHVADEDIELAPDLVWMGSINVIPSARRPLTSLEGLGRGASAAVPHTQVAMESLPRMMGEAPRYNYTTGAITQINYIRRKAGRLAEFHHSYGALLVEVDGDDWWARHVLADSKGRIADLDLMVDGDAVTPGHTVDTLTCGDLHHAQRDTVAYRALLGQGGLVERCRPEHLVLHDTLDFRSRSHHLRSQPVQRHWLWAEGHDRVCEEVGLLHGFLASLPDGLSVVVVDSNHDRHLTRWLDEADWRHDPANAHEILRWNLYRLDSPGAHMFAHVLRELGPLDNVKFLRLGESWRRHGVEHGLHGDIGVNGARASPLSLAKLGSRSTVGHSHSPSIHQGVYTVGTTSKLDMGYNRGGATRWAHAHCLLYSTGKRAIICPNRERAYL